MDIDEINKAITAGVKAGVKAALEEELKPFFIDKETHYKQHEFLGDMIEYSRTCKSVVLKTILCLAATAAVGLMITGFFVRHGGK